MIDRSEILAIAGIREIRADLIEKDYILGWLLAGIAAHPALGPSWVFKGGTCLKKCFLETYRLSEDLDFTLEDASHLDDGFLTRAFGAVASWLYDESGIDIVAQAPRFEVYRNSRGAIQVEGRIYYRGPTPLRGSLPRIKLDLTADERIVHQPVGRGIAHPYSDRPMAGFSTRTYPLPELAAEKIRALGERARPRDLYDVIGLFRREDLRPEPSALLQVLGEKCDFKGIPVPSPTSLERFREEMEGDWEVMLGHQLPAVPPLETLWAALPEFFDWLHGGSVAPALAKIPLHPDEEVMSASASGQELGMNPLHLERVRFASANRLCVDLRYGSSTRTVEPYSLRRAHGGQVLLYACPNGDPEYSAYDVNETIELEISRESFIPQYAVELLPPVAP